MAFLQNILRISIAGLLFTLSISAFSQTGDTTTSDGLFQAARKAAFDEKNYSKAKAYIFRAIDKSPDYADLHVFLGRIYTWTNNYDSARLVFNRVLAMKPDYEEASVAYSDLEYFDGKYERSLKIASDGLKNNPASEALMFREAKNLNALHRSGEAERAVRRLLLLNPDNEDGKALLNSILADARKTAGPQTTSTSNNNSSDELLAAAKKAAFDEKNYELAKQYLYQALKQSPDYADVKVFLGRVHTWTDHPDSARYYFAAVLNAKPEYEDASLAYADLEYWNNNFQRSLDIVDAALKHLPASEALLFRKARVLNAMRRYQAADSTVQHVLQVNRNNTEARALAARIRELSILNKIGLSYDYVYFDKQFADPWHLASFDYTRSTPVGSFTGRINYANRFKESGVQYEIEAYPHISRTFYSYVNIGYSDKIGVFPNWRGGFSLYINLPKSYEAELGVRYLKFTGDPTWIYTAYLGKYYRSWLFGIRTYITPATNTSAVSSSYNVTGRYYFGGADDYWGFTLGYGISPDDRLNSIQLENPVKLITYKAGLTFKKKISKLSVLSTDFTYYNQEYLPATRGNQYQFSIGWQQRF